MKVQNIMTKVTAAAFAVTAFPVMAADSATSYNIYGLIDLAVVNQNTGFGNKVKLDGGGGKDQSRLGIDVKRPLTDGLTAIARLEGGLLVNSGAMGGGAPANGVNVTTPSSSGNPGTGAQVFSREAWGGLEGAFGRATVGRQYSGSYSALSMGSAYGGYYNPTVAVINSIGLPTRISNSLLWKSPALGNFNVSATWLAGSENNVAVPTASGTTLTTDQAGVGYDLAAFYKNGPADLALTTWSINTASYATGETGLAKKQGTQVAARYNFGAFTLAGAYLKGTIGGNNYEKVTKTLSSSNGFGLSAIVPVGEKHSFVATYSRLNDKSLLNRDATFPAVSYSYMLAKDAFFYTSYGKTRNSATAKYAVYDAGNMVGDIAATGVSPKSMMVGVNYRF